MGENPGSPPLFDMSPFLVHKKSKNETKSTVLFCRIYNRKLWHFYHSGVLGTPHIQFFTIIVQALSCRLPCMLYPVYLFFYYFQPCLKTRRKSKEEVKYLKQKSGILFILVNACSLGTNVSMNIEMLSKT